MRKSLFVYFLPLATLMIVSGGCNLGGDDSDVLTTLAESGESYEVSPSPTKPFDAQALVSKASVDTLSYDIGSALGSPVVSGNTCGAANQRTPSCAYSSAADHTYVWSAPFSGTFRITTINSGFDTVLHVYHRSNGSAMGCNDDSGGTFQSSVTVSVLAGQQLNIVVDGYGGACGNFALNIAAVSDRVALYRYYNTGNYDHFYTANWSELGSGSGNWKYEGIAGYVLMTQPPGAVPLYRYYHTGNYDHFYTTDWSELGSGGGRWVYEGVAGYVPTSSSPSTTNLYRYYNTGNYDHFYTTDWSELGSGGGRWIYEGVACLIYTQP
jgi:hypothetical protein